MQCKNCSNVIAHRPNGNLGVNFLQNSTAKTNRKYVDQANQTAEEALHILCYQISGSFFFYFTSNK